MKTSTLLILAAFITGPVIAEPELPEVLRDAEPQQLMGVGFGLMKLSDAEKETFGEIIRTFGNDVRAAVASEYRRNAPHAQRRVRRRLDNLFDDLDKRVAPIVTEDRRNGYLIFKKGLVEQMRPDP